MAYVDEHPGATTKDIMYAIWGVRPGGGTAYEQARSEYVEIFKMFNELARKNRFN
jgi:hypothetical protein